MLQPTAHMELAYFYAIAKRTGTTGTDPIG